MANLLWICRREHSGRFWYFVAIVIFMLMCTAPVLADIAPPESPPGSNLMPGSEITQVRMESETVVLDVLSQSQSSWIGQAKVTATFHMRNLGSDNETIQVRFPLSNLNGWGDGFGNFPEIRDLRIKVDGRTVPTRRITAPNSSGNVTPEIPWATFEVAFPAEQDIPIEVTYTADGFGEGQFVVFNYIMETGAGWYGTIGRADLIVRLPYDVDPKNVIFEQIGYGMTSANPEFQGTELRWHYQDLEPNALDNLQVVLVTPAAWNKVLLELGRVQKNPNDGEAWGRLGKAYKAIITLRKGIRSDEGGQQAYRLAVEAYDRAVSLKPNDPLWHYGFADLLWSHFYWVDYWNDQRDYTDLEHAVRELQRCLELDPANLQALEMLDWISSAMPEAVQVNGDQISYLILTATPQPAATGTPIPSETPVATIEAPTATARQTAAVTSTSQPTDIVLEPAAATDIATLTPAPAQTAQEKRNSLPCGSSLLPLFGLLFVVTPKILPGKSR